MQGAVKDPRKMVGRNKIKPSMHASMKILADSVGEYKLNEMLKSQNT